MKISKTSKILKARLKESSENWLSGNQSESSKIYSQLRSFFGQSFLTLFYEIRFYFFCFELSFWYLICPLTSLARFKRLPENKHQKYTLLKIDWPATKSHSLPIDLFRHTIFFNSILKIEAHIGRQNKKDNRSFLLLRYRKRRKTSLMSDFRLLRNVNSIDFFFDAFSSFFCG